MLGIKYDIFVNFCSIIFPLSPENSKALDTMFFAEGQKCSVWLAANQKCLVLKEDRTLSVHSVTFAGEGG